MPRATKGKKAHTAAEAGIRFGLSVVAWTLLSAGCGATCGLGVQVRRLAHRAPERTALQARNEARTGRVPRKIWLDLDQMDRDVKHAVLVSEDIRFFEHSGFDFHEVKVALQDAYDTGRPPRGASTLTQQLAKNLYLSSERSLVRKAWEAVYTLFLEGLLTKERILELYLNEVEFGPQVYGVEAAARHHFHRSARDLSPRQAAQLAALLPEPHRQQPGSQDAKYVARWKRIEARMEKTQDLKVGLR